MAIFANDLLTGPMKRALYGAPPGHDARALAELARQAGGRGVIAVLQDELEAAQMAEQLTFFVPQLAQLTFPAWDCLPYDRSSPSPGVLATRAATLSMLGARHDATTPLVIITTAAALTQRVPPPDAFAARQLDLRAGGTVQRTALQSFLALNGYRRVTTVREPGDYALRGDIADLFPPDADAPVRIDFFDTRIEALKRFDAMTQLTTGPLDALRLERTAELVLDEDAVARFRAGYRALFGAQLADDPLYQAVSEGQAYAGVEHWLPLFYDRLATLPDFLPQAPVWLGWQVRAAMTSALAQVEDFYTSRAQLLTAAKKERAAAYKPLPPARLYLPQAELDGLLDGRRVFDISPFAPADSEQNLLDAGGRKGRDFAADRIDGKRGAYDAALAYADAQRKAGNRTLLAAYSRGSADRLRHLLVEHGATDIKDVADGAGVAALDKKSLGIAVLPLESGFVGDGLAVITEQDLLGDRLARPRQKRRRSDAFVIDLGALEVGDLVVHEQHGIARFDGLITLEIGGDRHDCLRLVYSGNDRLFLPVENLELLSRYGGGDEGGGEGALDKLGGAGWQARRARVKKRLKDMADALLKIAAERELTQAPVAEVTPGPYDEFCARFPYAETEDQARAIDQSLEDLTRGRPMDRLVCGDVGFGKTEVALRAAFVAAAAGLQVAVVVPTTLLARQHARNFAARFRGFPFKIAQLSRFVNAADSKAVKAGLADGSIDIVIGTHALLGAGVAFNRLGLVIVDEEQHFGVKQKEKLKALTSSGTDGAVHVLTLSATPIPRTMQLALAGVRELSLIATPPVDRLAVRTTVLPTDPLIVREALLREHWRGGQSFYVAPHVEDLGPLAAQLRELVPELKLVTAHGQLAAGQLDEIMAAFDDGQYDVLLATNIIESGLDIPRANTIVVHKSDRFGLAQLYQLRGRVGRAKARGYAYLTTPAGQKLTPSAEARLKVMETLDTLGAGFQLASHDLDIRGAGNLLGEEQSGHIREVGIELYQEMLKEAVEAARNNPNSGELAGSALQEGWSPQISLGVPVMLPESYVADLSLRLSLYRRIADITDTAQLDAFAAELTDRFGPLPEEVVNLLATVEIKSLCKRLGIEKLDAGPNGGVIAFRGNRFAAPDRLIAFVQHGAGTLKVRPDMKLVATRVWSDKLRRLGGVKKLLEDLMGLLPESAKAA